MYLLVNMKRRLLIFCYILLSASCMSVWNAHAEAILGLVSVEIKERLEILEKKPMSFGVIFLEGNEGVVVSLGTTDTVSVSGTTSQNGDGVQSADFLVQGAKNEALTISFQEAVLSGPGEAILLKNFVHDAGASPSFDSSGILSFKVGADIEINANQLVGYYSGLYQVLINYQ